MQKAVVIDPNLIQYRVMLHQEKGDKFQIAFECWAEDDDHAVEQAKNAYPDCEVVSSLPFDNSPLDYVIYSPNESALTDGDAGFWSNEDGWCDFTTATRFTKAESETLNLPISTGQDAKWVLWDEANASYGGKTESLDEFQRDVAVCCDCMLQDDAMGETLVFVRENGILQMKAVSADEIDFENLQQYEMIMFDGGNKYGDLWKHVFYPRQKQHFFVDENPLPRQPANKPDGNIQVSLDGGETYQDAPSGVRIVYHDMPIPGEDANGELHINATEEGLIMDVWATRDEPLDHNIGTSSEMSAEIVERLVEDGA